MLFLVNTKSNSPLLQFVIMTNYNLCIIHSFVNAGDPGPVNSRNGFHQPLLLESGLPGFVGCR